MRQPCVLEHGSRRQDGLAAAQGGHHCAGSGSSHRHAGGQCDSCWANGLPREGVLAAMLVLYVKRLSWACLGPMVTQSSDLAVVESAAAKCSPMLVVEARQPY